MEKKEKIKQLQLIEQNVQQLLSQKQEQQTALIEIESAIQELNDVNKAYKIIGNIMVQSNKEKLTNELNEKKEVINLRIKTIQKQEDKLKDKAKIIQKELVKEMENGKNGKQ